MWHQGENECSPDSYKLYYEKFVKIIEAFRLELDEPDIPVIMGGLGEYLGNGFLGKYFNEHPRVNQEILKFAKSNENCYFVTAKKLTLNPDGIHINAISYRIFGLRYFEAYNKHKHVLELLEDEENARTLTKTEKLTILENQFAGGHISLEEYQSQLLNINS